MAPNDAQPPRPRFMDALGALCQEGLDGATYLFQVPDDSDQRERLRAILAAIAADPVVKGRREFPKLTAELREVLNGPPTPGEPELLMDGFQRMVRLWQTTRSGIF